MSKGEKQRYVATHLCPKDDLYWSSCHKTYRAAQSRNEKNQRSGSTETKISREVFDKDEGRWVEVEAEIKRSSSRSRSSRDDDYDDHDSGGGGSQGDCAFPNDEPYWYDSDRGICHGSMWGPDRD